MPLAIGLAALTIVGCIVVGAATVILRGGGLSLLPQASPTAALSPTFPPPTTATLIPTSSPVQATPTPVSGADAYEPDDNIAQAKPIDQDGSPQTHNLHMQGDRDHMSFEAQGGTNYTIETRDLGSNIDTIIYLYDDEGNELANDDDGAEESLASRLIWAAPNSGPYFVMIRDLGEESAGAHATYSIAVTAEGVIEGDRYEPDDTIAQAGPIDTDGTHQTHTFHTSVDADYVYFVAQQGVEYVVETGNLHGDCDTVLYLSPEDAEDWQLEDDDGGEGIASRLVWTAESSGTYFVRIEDFWDQAGPEVSYDVWVGARPEA